jgi:HD-like signal output (HDOD) protein
MSTATTTDPKILVEQALKKVTSIATLPEITGRIIKTVEDPKSSAAQLHQLVSHDPALVTRILKVVNSSFYGLPGQIASVERAIVLLGLNAVKNIAVAASLGQMFRGAKLCDEFTAKDLWSHCLAVGVTARELTRLMKLPVGDEAFLAGMIHDVGLIVALQIAPEKLRKICELAKTDSRSFCDIERDVMGVDHQQLGQGLAEAWKFPRACQLVAGFHHQPATLSGDARRLVALIHVADTLCCEAKMGFYLTAANQTIDIEALADLSLDPAMLDQLRQRLPALMSDTASFVA